MKRSFWPIVLFVFLLLAMTVLLPGNMLAVRARSLHARARLFVLVQGLDTHLQGNEPPANSFGKAGGIAAYLRTTYPGSQLLMYSYSGYTSHGYPVSYACQDTFGTVTDDTQRFATQLQDYLKDKTNMDVYVVAHSFGGLIAYGYLSYLTLHHTMNGMIAGTTGDRIAGIVTLDSPLGGVANDLYLAKTFLRLFYVAGCPKMVVHDTSALKDLFHLYTTGNLLPHGARNSIAEMLFKESTSNEKVAREAAFQKIHVLTIGNKLDYLYDPAACKLFLNISLPETNEYLSTQWLVDRGERSGIYGRVFADGKPACTSLLDLAVNHEVVFSERSVQTALGQLIDDEPLTALPVAPNDVLSV